jgi:hypothetical protein
LATILQANPKAAREPAQQAVRYQDAALKLSQASRNYQAWLREARDLLRKILLRLDQIEKAPAPRTTGWPPRERHHRIGLDAMDILSRRAGDGL